MQLLTLETPSLRLVLKSLEESLAAIESTSPEERREVSEEWLAKFKAATEPDPWVHGFAIVFRADGREIGGCGFKGPPEDGICEIAYAIAPEFQGRGYATEAAVALVEFAGSHNDVRQVHAHTLPEENSSTRVLTKCGFEKTGEVIDPEDGLVWRWEKLP